MAEGVHLTGEQLACLARGEASAAERDAALAHLRECEACGDRLAAILLLRQMRPRRAWRRWAVVAAGIAAIAVLCVLAARPAWESAPEPLTAERQALVDRFAAFASRENIPPLIYDFILRIDYPDIIPVSPNQHLPRTRAAVIDMRDGRYDEAVAQLATLHSEYPDFHSIAGWLGVALHLSGETDPVVEAMLRRGKETEIDPLRRMSTWYLAQHFLLTGRPEAAVSELAALAGIPTMVGRMALAQLEAIPIEELDVDDPLEGVRSPNTERTSLRKHTCSHRPVASPIGRAA